MGSSVAGCKSTSPANILRITSPPVLSEHKPGSITSGSLLLLIQISPGGCEGFVTPKYSGSLLRQPNVIAMAITQYRNVRRALCIDEKWWLPAATKTVGVVSKSEYRLSTTAQNECELRTLVLYCLSLRAWPAYYGGWKPPLLAQLGKDFVSARLVLTTCVEVPIINRLAEVIAEA